MQATRGQYAWPEEFEKKSIAGCVDRVIIRGSARLPLRFSGEVGRCEVEKKRSRFDVKGYFSRLDKPTRQALIFWRSQWLR